MDLLFTDFFLLFLVQCSCYKWTWNKDCTWWVLCWVALSQLEFLILRGIPQEENWLVSAAPFWSPTFSLCAGVFPPIPADFAVVVIASPFLHWEQSKADTSHLWKPWEGMADSFVNGHTFIFIFSECPQTVCDLISYFRFSTVLQCLSPACCFIWWLDEKDSYWGLKAGQTACSSLTFLKIN